MLGETETKKKKLYGFTIILNNISKIIKTSVWEKKKRMLRCTVTDKNAIKDLQDMPNFAASVTDKSLCHTLHQPPQ